MVTTHALWQLLERTVRGFPTQSLHCLPVTVQYQAPSEVKPQLTNVLQPSRPAALMGHGFPLAFPPIQIPPS